MSESFQRHQKGLKQWTGIADGRTDESVGQSCAQKKERRGDTWYGQTVGPSGRHGDIIIVSGDWPTYGRGKETNTVRTWLFEAVKYCMQRAYAGIRMSVTDQDNRKTVVQYEFCSLNKSPSPSFLEVAINDGPALQ